MKVQKSTVFREDKLGLFETLQTKVTTWYQKNKKRVTIRHAVYNVTRDNTNPDLYKRTVNLSYLRRIRVTNPVCSVCEKDPCECCQCLTQRREVFTEPTCTTNGVVRYYCADCGVLLRVVISELPALGHVEGTGVVITQPTCIMNGVTVFRCTRCNIVMRTVNTPSLLGHSFGDWGLHFASSCAVSGQEIRSCTRCDHFETRSLPILGHEEDDGTVTVEPTCVNNGITEFRCTRCGGLMGSKSIPPALGHAPEVKVVPPTCTAQGVEITTCTRCGVELGRVDIDPVGHDWSDWYVVKDPTCIEDGMEKRDCSVFGCIETNTIPPLGHIENSTPVREDPTCYFIGVDNYFCTRCDILLRIEFIDILDHDWGEWKETTAATCTTAAIEIRSCGRCEYVESRTGSAALDHNYQWIRTKNPTIHEEGEEVLRCTRCGDIIDTIIIPKLCDHQYCENCNQCLLCEGCECVFCPGCNKVICECLTIITNRNIIITAPKLDESPVYSLDNPQWTASIQWTPIVMDVYKPTTVYTANITITPKEGFTTIGIPSNTWRVNGVITTHEDDASIVIFTFPETDPRAINVVPPEDVRASFILVNGTLVHCGTADYLNAITAQGNPNSLITVPGASFRKSDVVKFTFDPQWNLTQIPNNFLSNFINLKEISPIPNIVTRIGNSFLLGCISLEGPIRIPASVTQIGNSFMSNCNNLTHLIVSPPFITAVRDGDRSTLSVELATAKAYVDGLYVEGLSGSELTQLLARLPNSTTSPFRRILIEHLPGPMQVFINETLF